MKVKKLINRIYHNIRTKIPSKRKITGAIKRWLQRRARGWDDSETWNLDITFADYIVPRLIRYKQIKGGHPYELSSEAWDEILEKMIKAFSLIRDQFEIQLKHEYHKINWNEVQEGLDLFAKYYMNLWD